MDSTIRRNILDATIRVYREYGPKFTMNDLAKELGMSKKTIYTVFKDKESLLLAMVDYFFDSVKMTETVALKNAGDDAAEKLKAVMSAMPEVYEDVDFTQMYILQEKYPLVYENIEKRLESGWEETLSIIEEGIENKQFRPINTMVFQLSFEASIERFLVGDELKRSGVEYSVALNSLVEMLVDGIKA